MGPTSLWDPQLAQLSFLRFRSLRSPVHACLPPPACRPHFGAAYSSSSPTTARDYGRRFMSTSSSASRPSWPKYGAVPMTRCPDCTRAAPLKRLVTIKEENGNFVREFVKCESKPKPGKKCYHFEWIDEYVERPKVEGIIDFRRGATREINQAPAVEKFATGDGELIGEVKKLNKHLRQMVGLQKQANVIITAFYFCIIFLGIVYLQLISR